MKIVMRQRDEVYADYLREKGFFVTTVDLQGDEEDEVIEKMKGFQAIVARGEKISARVLDALSDELKIVVRHGIGFDRVDIEHAAELGICCCNTPGMMSTGVAEGTVIHILEVSRKLYQRHNDILVGKWGGAPLTHELEGKTVGFVGFGSIARKAVQYLSGFKCRILAYDIAYDEAFVEQYGVQKASMDEIARESDFVSVHVPLLPSTRHCINKAFLEKMKPSAFLINTSRGGTVDQDALIQALKNGTIAGAGLDVFENEPMEEDCELKKLDNVFLTPHCTTGTFECQYAGFDGVMFALREYMDGKVPAFCLNPAYVQNKK